MFYGLLENEQVYQESASLSRDTLSAIIEVPAI
mgnify:FL=1